MPGTAGTTRSVVVLAHVLASLIVAQSPVEPAGVDDGGPLAQQSAHAAESTPLDEPDGLAVLPPSLRDGPPSSAAVDQDQEPAPVEQVLVDVPLRMHDGPPQIPSPWTQAEWRERKLKRLIRTDKALVGVTWGGVGLIMAGATAMWVPWVVGPARSEIDPRPCDRTPEGCFNEPYVEFGVMIGGAALVTMGIITAAIAGSSLRHHRRRHGLGRWAGRVRPAGSGLTVEF